MCDLSVYYLFLQYFDTVGWVFWPAKTVSQITYTVLVEMLNPAQSINQSISTNIWRHWLQVLDSELKAYNGIVKNLGKEAEKLKTAEDPADAKEIAAKQVDIFICPIAIDYKITGVCLSVCHCSCGHSFESNLMKLCTVVWGRKTKIEFIRESKFDNAFPYFTPSFHQS